MNRYFLLILTLLCCTQRQSIGSALIEGDDSVYRFQLSGSSACFISENDTICISKQKFDSSAEASIFSLMIDSRIVFVDPRVKGAYSIGEASHENDSYFLDFPLGQFYIEPGPYSDKRISCSVVFNGKPNKPEKELTRNDWNDAKRKKVRVNSLMIVDTETNLLYASITRLKEKNGVTQYELHIPDQCPDKSRLLFKSVLFLILWKTETIHRLPGKGP